MRNFELSIILFDCFLIEWKELFGDIKFFISEERL